MHNDGIYKSNIVKLWTYIDFLCNLNYNTKNDAVFQNGILKSLRMQYPTIFLDITYRVKQASLTNGKRRDFLNKIYKR